MKKWFDWKGMSFGLLDVDGDRDYKNATIWAMGQEGRFGMVSWCLGNCQAELNLTVSKSNSITLKISLPLIGTFSTQMGGFLPKRFVPRETTLTGLRYMDGGLDVSVFEPQGLTLNNRWWQTFRFPIVSLIFGKPRYSSSTLKEEYLLVTSKSGAEYRVVVQRTIHCYYRPRFFMEKVETTAKAIFPDIRAEDITSGEIGVMQLNFYEVKSLQDLSDVILDIINDMENLASGEDEPPGQEQAA